jgi:uncharacterized membrane protein YgdD (TMEM256/DUF423 family)
MAIVFESRMTLALAAKLLALATIAGALGAHLLQTKLAASQMQLYETAVRYQFFHALGLLGMGLAAQYKPARLLCVAAVMVFAGVLCFSGSLYLLAFGVNFGLPLLVGLMTPLGGVLLITGWFTFAWAVWRR